MVFEQEPLVAQQAPRSEAQSPASQDDPSERNTLGEAQPASVVLVQVPAGAQQAPVGQFAPPQVELAPPKVLGEVHELEVVREQAPAEVQHAPVTTWVTRMTKSPEAPLYPATRMVYWTPALSETDSMSALNAGTGPQHVQGWPTPGPELEDESSLHAIMLSCVAGQAVWTEMVLSYPELQQLNS